MDHNFMEALKLEGLSRIQINRIAKVAGKFSGDKSGYGGWVGDRGGDRGGYNIPTGFGGDGPSAPTRLGGGCGTSLSGDGEPWTIVSTTPIGAASLSANSSLVEVFDASQSAQIDTDNKVPDDFECEFIKCYIGIQGVVDGGIENIAILASFFLREAEGSGGGQEQAIWHLSDIGTTTGQQGGFGTSTGSGAYVREMVAAGIPWPRSYSTQGTYSLQYRITLGATTLNIIDVTTVLSGRRFAKG